MMWSSDAFIFKKNPKFNKIPLGLADKIARTLEKKAEKKGEKPMMIAFSVYNLARNNEFDQSKAKEELGYTTRSYKETIHDEVEW